VELDEVQGDFDPRSKLLNSFAGGYVEISVTDRGFGVPLGDQKRIFEKFVRVNRRVHGDTSGTGLGLSIAQNLVKAHGGELWVESTPGEGASFVFRIPIFDRYGALAVSIADRLSLAKRDRRSIGMIVLRLFYEGGKEGDVTLWTGAGDLAEVARGALLRSTDYAVFNPHLGEVVVILEGCMKEILPQVAVRVASEIRNHFKSRSSKCVTISTGHTFSPSDSTMEEAMKLLGDARRLAAAKKEAERRILIVDDDELFARSTARLLGMYHFQATCVGSADEAIAAMEKVRPDLIMMDILMPEFDGFRLALEVRDHPELKDIPIVFISGVDRDDVTEKILSVGDSDFLQKPIEAADLIAKLKTYMG
jgi:CheY-like chemotaxis protein